MQTRTRRTVLALLFLLSGWPAALQAQSLREAADARGLSVGAAVAMSPFRNEAVYTETLRREFNMLVAENAFKWDALRPSQNTFNFTDADALVAFAEANGMAVRGHTLVWHNQLPGWLTGGNFSRDDVIAILRDHILTVVGRYQGRIVSWDVVNEAIDDGNGQLRTSSFWYQRIGPDYVRLAFQFAREADPSATLYYNDYSAEGLGTKSDGVYQFVQGLRAQGVPIHGVGWQMHQVNGFRIQDQHRTNARRLAALGLEISITEMDVRIPLPTDSQELQQQALAYGDVTTFCLTEPNCRAVVAWGFTDRHSWIPGFFGGFGDALIFDANYQPKPAYIAIRNALGPTPSPSPSPSPSPTPPPPPPPTFTLSTSPSSLSINQGASGTTTVNVTRAGFTGSVDLNVNSLPSGVTASFSSDPTTGNSSVLTLSASTTAAVGTFTVNILGAGSPGLRTTPLSLTVNQSGGGGGGGTGGVAVIPAIVQSSPWYNDQAVRLSNTGTLAALTITVVVQKTPGLSANGMYDTVGGQIQQSRSETATTITYRWTLAPGQTLSPGSGRQFSAQTNGSGTAHPTSGDTWTVTYTAGGSSFTQTGGF